MGRTSRWFKSLLGGKKEAKQASHADPSLSNTKDKRRWSFGKSSKDRPVHQEHRVPCVDNNYMCDAENEQNRHAVAVAAATAAAADAAVAAAQAAVAVVRLTSNGRLSLYSGRETWAAIRIQTLFRGYLARRALRALKGLVKLQALVRGYLVRKQADATLYCMQSLVRIQARVRAQRLWLSEEAPGAQMYQRKRRQQESRPRKSTERWNAGVDNATYYSQSRRGFAYGFPQQEMETNLDESAKIVEIDTFRPKVRSKRRVCSTSDSGSAEPSISSTAGRYSMPNFTLQSSSPPENEGSITAKYVSPLKACFSTRVSIPSPASDDLSSIDLNGDWAYRGEDYKFLTAKSSPQFCSSASKFGVTSTSTFTPSKIEYAHNYSQGYCAFPNYMSNTESSRAKVRSQSAPKQRPDDKTAFLVKKRTSLQEAAETRSSFSGVRMQSSCFQAQETCNAYQHSGPARLDRPTMSFRDSECDRFHSQWW